MGRPMASTDPLTACVVFARQAVRTVDAITRDLPADISDPLRAEVRADLAHAEEQEREWLQPLAIAGMMAEANRLRAEAQAETAALARPGETPYQTRARLLGRE